MEMSDPGKFLGGGMFKFSVISALHKPLLLKTVKPWLDPGDTISTIKNL